MRVIKHSKDLDLSFNFFKYSLLLYFLLIKNLDCNLMASYLILCDYMLNYYSDLWLRLTLPNEPVPRFLEKR